MPTASKELAGKLLHASRLGPQTGDLNRRLTTATIQAEHHGIDSRNYHDCVERTDGAAKK